MIKTSNISKLPIWDMLSKDEQEYVKKHSNESSYRKDNVIYSHDMSCLGMIYVESGSLRVIVSSEEGREITLFRLKEGDYCIFSAGCALQMLNVETEMITESDTIILSVSPDAFNHLIQTNIQVKCFTYELITKRLTIVVNVLQEILFERLDTRLARYLLERARESGNQEILITQEALARELNSVREVITRMLGKFANAKLIEIGHGRIRILDEEGLEDI